MEPLATYSEQRFDGKRTFQLFEDRLVIHGSEALSSTYEQTVTLETLRPEIDRTWHRSPYFRAGVKQAAGSFIAASVLHSGFGMAWNTYLIVLAAVGVVTGLLLASAARQKVEYTIFKTQAGVASVSLARAGKQSNEYDGFIERLTRQIQVCRPPRMTPETAG